MTNKRTYPDIPRWTSKVYSLLALVTIPWTLYLAVTLPVRHISSNWDTVWVGFDTGLIIMLFATALFAYLRSQWIAITATATATLLIVDAWFDIWTAHHGKQLDSSLALAIFVELPLAIITGTIACKVIAHKNT